MQILFLLQSGLQLWFHVFATRPLGAAVRIWFLHTINCLALHFSSQTQCSRRCCYNLCMLFFGFIWNCPVASISKRSALGVELAWSCLSRVISFGLPAMTPSPSLRYSYFQKTKLLFILHRLYLGCVTGCYFVLPVFVYNKKPERGWEQMGGDLNHLKLDILFRTNASFRLFAEIDFSQCTPVWGWVKVETFSIKY